MTGLKRTKPTCLLGPMLARRGAGFRNYHQQHIRLPMRKSESLTADVLAERLNGAPIGWPYCCSTHEHDAEVARRLRIAVAARRDSAAAVIGAEIRRLKRGTSLVDYKRMLAFARDLSALGAAIEGPLADADPGIGARTHVRFHRSGASTDRAQRRQRRVHRGHIRSACAAAALLAARASAALPPNAPVFARPNLSLRRNGVADGIIAAFAQALDAATRTALCLWIETDLARLPPPADPDSAAGRLSAWKLIQALASRMRPVMSIPTVRLSSVSARGCAIMLASRAA